MHILIVVEQIRLERPPGVQEVMDSFPVGDSDFFSFAYARVMLITSLFHISLSTLKFTVLIHLSNLKLVVNIQVAKEVPEDIMPEGEGVILILIVVTVPVEGEEVVIFLVVGVVVVEQVVVMEGKEEQHLLL